MVAVPNYPRAATSTITFGDRVQGFLTLPTEGQAPFDAVVLGHERYGLVQHTLDLAAKFARDGLVCLAPDLYSHWDGDKEALARGELDTQPIPDSDVQRFLSAGLDFLREHPKVNPDRIAAMGVCLSGSYPLILNSMRSEITANIVIYGAAQKQEWTAGPPQRTESFEEIIGRITAPVLAIFGEDDFVISIDDMRRFRNTLEEKRKTYEMTLFPHMPHGWMNSTMPGRYRPQETERVWSMILDFIQRANDGAFPRDRALWKFQADSALDYDFTKKVRLA